MRNIISRNPYSGQIKSKIQSVAKEALSHYISKSSHGFTVNSKRSLKDKQAMLTQLIRHIQKKQKDIANLITFQTGKPILASQFQIHETLKLCRYYTEPQKSILPMNVKTDAKKKTLIKYLPLGTIYYILPFNYPFYLNLYKTLPQLILGNSVLIKNSDSTPEIGKLIENLMIKVGFQSGQYQNIFASNDLSQEIIKNQHIMGVSFTGSSQNGKNIAAIAGKYIKKSSLHLNTNDSLIILEDGDVDLAISQLFKKTQFNGGQGFPNPKRIIVKTQLYQNIKIKLIDKINKLTFGNPYSRDVQIGPIARQDLYLKLQNQLKAIQKKFKIINSRKDMQRPFFPLTLIQGGQQIYDQQIIGPILFLYKCSSDEEIINLANNSKYGNSNYIFSKTKRSSFINELKAPHVYYNQIAFFNPMVPMGGIAQSGYGYQGWNEGIRHFANIKTNYIN